MKADREAAYSQLPLDRYHAKLAVVALRLPVGGRWYGSVSRTLTAGAIAAALRYNLFPSFSLRWYQFPMRSFAMLFR